jgi:chromosome segregation ATPase
MIEENENSRFQFSATEDEPETLLHDELRELKIEKLAHRVTLLTILIPCMVGIILVIAYLDIKDRVTRSYDTGTIGVQKLSKDLASKFSSLSLEQAKIKDIQASKIPDLEKSAAFLKSRITKLQESMDQMSASSIDKDELARVTKTLTDKLADLEQEIKSDVEALASTNSQIVDNSQKLTNDIGMQSENLAEIDIKIDTIRKEIKMLSESFINKDDLELALKLKEIGYRQSLLDKTALLNKEIQIIQKEVKALQKKNSASSAVAPATQPPSPASTKPVSEIETNKPTASEPEPGGIVEQTIE